MIFKAAQVESYCKKPDMNIKAVLVYGPNEGLAAEYARKFALSVVADLNDPFCAVDMSWDEVKRDVGRLVGEYNAQSLLAGRRVILLRDADNDLTKVLQSFIEESKSDTLLVVNGGATLNNRSSLVNYFNTEKFLAAAACYEDRDEGVATSARQMLTENQITYTREAFELLCSRLSNDRKSNINEIDKLVTYVGSKKHFDIEDVRKTVFDASVSAADDLGFYVFSGLKIKALNALKNLLNEGVEEVQIVRALSRHANMLLEGKALTEDGINAGEAIKKVLSKRLFYRYDMGERQISAWSKDRLFDAMSLLYKAERDCKTTNYPSVEIVNYLVLTLTAAGAKLLHR
ncbi:MAG: DNA polymerase III subunit delta [Alphaproteobacteria bacterium]|nr:DNA polymerase III subunit delta [Alphaproteobacteria bacterium]MBQ9236182.1 DNA polymerase III subunit delta [Alphaproteobacteria bacterium]